MGTRRTTGSVRTTAAAEPAQKAEPRQRAPSVKAAAEPEASTAITVSPEVRRAMVAQAAFLRAERRGFLPGGEVEDWLAAEAEVDALLRAGNSGPPQ